MWVMVLGGVAAQNHNPQHIPDKLCMHTFTKLSNKVQLLCYNFYEYHGQTKIFCEIHNKGVYGPTRLIDN
jgi:hypothetical protein